MEDVVETIRAFCRYLDEAMRAYTYNERRIAQLDGETQDLLHELELHDHKYHERARLAGEIERVRRERRACKEQNEELKPLVDYLTREGIRQKLGQVQGQIDAVRKRQAARTYTPRVRAVNEITGGITDGKDAKNGVLHAGQFG